MKVILAHGVLGFGAINVLHQHVNYFKGVAKDLSDLGISVATPSLGPTDPVRERAAKLAAAINGFFSQDEPGYIIAHSMGGLDAQYALAHLDVAQRVKSLVTIGTPYFGSPIADLISPSHTLHSIAGIEPVILRELESSVALHDLGTDAGAGFIGKNPDQMNVRYHHIAGVGRPVSIFGLHLFHTCAAFAGTFAIMAAHRLVNDGMVPMNSACRGEEPWEVWQVDHADEVGWDLDNPLDPPSDEHLARYRRVVHRLREEQ